MKKFLLTIATMIIFGNISAYAGMCECKNPNFTNDDKIQAIENFMRDKRNIEKIDINNIELFDGFEFESRRHEFVNLIIGNLLAADEEEKKCFKVCSELQSDVSFYKIKYLNNENKSCWINVELTMISYIFSNGFKSNVESGMEPVCE